MIIDSNLIAYEYYKDQFVPKEVYSSGKRDENNLIDKYSNGKNNAILILEDDIINEFGYGLKKGFYNVKPDEYLDFLLIYQNGKIKAKVPIIKTEIYETSETTDEKPKKMSYRKFQKEQEKKYRKYLNGENPEEIDFKEVKIEYIREDNSYILIYSDNRMDLVGIIKF